MNLSHGNLVVPEEGAMYFLSLIHTEKKIFVLIQSRINFGFQLFPDLKTPVTR